MSESGPRMSLMEERTLEHAWRYFELHANQRIAVFNFFVAFATAASAGLAYVVMGPKAMAPAATLGGVLLSYVSYLFWRLDQRTSFLVKHAESALVAAEAQLVAECGRVVSNEPEATETARATESSHGTGMWTYSEVFGAVFLILSLVGALGTVLGIVKWLGLATWPA